MGIKEKKQHKAVCDVCGKEFEASGPAKYCCDTCRNTGSKMRKTIREQGKASKKEKKKIKKQQQAELSIAAMKARKAGMSYGQYVAKYGY